MKKIISLALVFVMILALTISASAADQTPSRIVIEGAASTRYGAYRVLDAVIGDDRDAIVYSINTNFVNFFFPNGQPNANYITTVENANPVTYNGTTYYLNITGTANTDPNRVIDGVNSEGNVAALAEDLMEYINDPNNNITPNSQQVIAPNGTSTAFTGLPIGYYLIDSGAGALCALTTNNQEYKIIEKNEVPTVEKTVSAGGNGADVTAYTYSEAVSAMSGDNVYFKISTTIVKGQEAAYFWDIFNTADLSFVSSIIKYTAADGTEKTLTEGADADFTQEITNPAPGASQLVIDIADELIEEGAELDVYLTMTKLSGVNTTNTVRLYYTERPLNPSSDSAEVYSYGFKLNKTDSDGGALSGAQFVLATVDTLPDSAMEAANVKVFFGVDDEESPSIYTRTTSQTKDIIEAGSVTINGLASGTYWLHEIAAPDGYNRLTGPIKVEITNDFTNNAEGVWKITYPDGTTENINSSEVQTVEIDVVNNSGAELPSTGGMGTTLFYILGSLMAVGALVVLVTNKRVRV